MRRPGMIQRYFCYLDVYDMIYPKIFDNNIQCASLNSFGDKSIDFKKESNLLCIRKIVSDILEQEAKNPNQESWSGEIFCSQRKLNFEESNDEE